MTFLAPAFLYASLAVAAGVAALHFIVTRQPRAGILPTARFIPDMPATATARATRPSDLLLMLLRILLVVAAGAGLAKPVLKPSRGAEARVIVADVSRSVVDAAAVRDSARALYRDRDVLVLFDSSARVIADGAVDSIASIRPAGRQGNLSGALIAALRAASSIRERADSMQLVIVSPFAAEEFDAATETVRNLWPGKARVVRAGAGSIDTTVAAQKLEIRSVETDPMQAAAALARGSGASAGIILRDSPADSNAGSGRPVVQWPVTDRPFGAVPRRAKDTVGGVVAGDALVVSIFERSWQYPTDSLRDARVVARWIDGEPAAIEVQRDGFCNRSVAIPVSPAGDLVIRADFVAFVRKISGPCIGLTSLILAQPEALAALEGQGGLAPRESFKPRGDLKSPIAPWLIALAITAAVVELIVRRRRLLSPGARVPAARSGEARAA